MKLHSCFFHRGKVNRRMYPEVACIHATCCALSAQQYCRPPGSFKFAQEMQWVINLFSTLPSKFKVIYYYARRKPTCSHIQLRQVKLQKQSFCRPYIFNTILGVSALLFKALYRIFRRYSVQRYTSYKSTVSSCLQYV